MCGHSSYSVFLSVSALRSLYRRTDTDTDIPFFYISQRTRIRTFQFFHVRVCIVLQIPCFAYGHGHVSVSVSSPILSTLHIQYYMFRYIAAHLVCMIYPVMVWPFPYSAAEGLLLGTSLPYITSTLVHHIYISTSHLHKYITSTLVHHIYISTSHLH
jgi:hypothetical protein